MPTSLDAAQKEASRWRLRERRILEALGKVEEERVRLVAELGKVEEQVAYYASLTREMKKELGRPGLASFMSSLRKS